MLNMLTTKATCPCMLQILSGADPRFFAWMSTHDVNFRQKPMKFLIRLGHPLISGNGFSFKTTLDWNDPLVRQKFTKWKKWIVICIFYILHHKTCHVCDTFGLCIIGGYMEWCTSTPPPHVFFFNVKYFRKLAKKFVVKKLCNHFTEVSHKWIR